MFGAIYLWYLIITLCTIYRSVKGVRNTNSTTPNVQQSSLQNRKLMPKFVLKEMESLYIEELRSSINMLMANLESLPISKGSTDSKGGLQRLRRYNHRSVLPFLLCWLQFCGCTVSIWIVIIFRFLSSSFLGYYICIYDPRFWQILHLVWAIQHCEKYYLQKMILFGLDLYTGCCIRIFRNFVHN